ncbi:MAG: glycosyltransferase [Vicinamibacterales bacterium]
MKRLRVAFVCDELEIGGQEQSILDLVRRIDRARFAPRVYAFRAGRLMRELEGLDVPTLASHRSSGAAGRWSAADARAKVAFRRLLAERLRKDRIDVCLVSAWADGVAAAREAGVPAIVERVDGPKLLGTIRDKSSCDRIVCQSHAIRRLVEAQADFLRCRGVPITVVRNAVDLTRFDPDRYDRETCRRALDFAPDEFIVGSISRLAPVKNLGHLLEAARMLFDRMGDAARVRFVFVGPDRGAGATLAAQARALGLGSRVRFLGARRDVPEILRAIDAFVLPSFQDGVSVAVLEAMAMGVPVVVTQAESAAETAPDAALFIGPLDPYRTTLALRDLIDHAALRRELGRRARRLATRHGLDRMARGYERVLLDAVRAGARRRQSFRRRIAVMPGHPKTGRHPHAEPRPHAEPLSGAGRRGGVRLFDCLASEVSGRAADSYVLSLRDVQAAGGTDGPSHWPPRRRESFDNNSAGRASRRSVLRWINPDVVVTDCPRVVELVRGTLPGEEIVFMPEPGHACAGEGRALRAADRVVVASAGERRALVRRWPRWAWKVRQISTAGTDTVGAFERLLARERPRDPAAARQPR